MSKRRRFDVKAILADPDMRRRLMVPTIQATQAREGIETTREQAERAYYVVNEGERSAFFDLKTFIGGRDKSEKRHEMFARELNDGLEIVRHDIARRDFQSIEGSPLAYKRVGLVAPLFREAPSLEPTWGIARQGKATGNDGRWLRQWWEVIGITTWVPFSKGGDFCRFYYDVDLVLDWKEEHREALKESGNGLPSLELYFRPGLTWPRRTAKGFNVRRMKSGCVFADKGPALFPKNTDHTDFLLGVTNSELFEYLFQTKTSFSWEVGIIKTLPIPEPTKTQYERITESAIAIYQAKERWDGGNEISTHFTRPWLLNCANDDRKLTIPSHLDHLTRQEVKIELAIIESYERLNLDVYSLYGLPIKSQSIIKEASLKRTPEILWPEMEGRTVEQKRMEHVWRLLSYAVKRVIETDDDGIVPFSAVNNEPRLVDRVRCELTKFFSDRDANQVEVEIVNELKRNVKGYRKCGSIEEWLENAFFEYHCSLFKKRPIFWHIASAQGTSPSAFGVLVHYHRFDKNRMAKLRGTYLRDAIEEFRREAALADKAGRADDRMDFLSKIEEAQTLDRKLQAIQEGSLDGREGGDRDLRILTPWKSAEERPNGWNPDIDDGVKVNIEPLEKAGVLRVMKVVR